MSVPKLTPLAVLWPHVRRHGLRLTAVMALVVLTVGVDLAQPVLVQVAIDHHLRLSHPDFPAIARMSAVYLGLVLAAFGLTCVQEILLQATGQKIVREIRARLFGHILGLSVKYFDKNASGRIITNVVSDTEALNTFFTDVLSNVLRGTLTLLVIVAFMFRMDTGFALWCLVTVPFILAVSRWFQGKLRLINQEMRTRLSILIAYLAENLAGMSVVQVFHQERKQAREFDARNRSLLDSTLLENKLLLLFFLFTEALTDLGVVALIWFGTGPVLRGATTFGVLYAFVGFVRRFFQPINTITIQINVLQAMLVASERIAQTLSEEPDIPEPESPRVPEKIEGAVEFRDVRLAYRPGKDVLKGVTLSVKSGDRIGIVGTSGAGKTSLMNLLTRFYDATGGEVAIDGVPIREWPLDALRHTVGIVQQDIVLFGASVLDNVRFFRPEIPRERVEEVCREIGADTFIRRLRDGYDTVITERGSILSFGERQLLSFARALARDPRVLVLDEATASLDSESEAVLQEAILRVARGRTLLVVAHRLSTIQAMDSIVVLDNGLVVETGTHDELLALGKHYWRFHQAGQLERFLKV
jgi:ATP-binding cassette, subfamily B, multidrug efflux pump